MQSASRRPRRGGANAERRAERGALACPEIRETGSTNPSRTATASPAPASTATHTSVDAPLLPRPFGSENTPGDRSGPEPPTNGPRDLNPYSAAYSVVIIIMILVLFGWITTARLVRASFLSLREREFTMAAQALGTGNRGIMFRHLVPNSMAPIIVEGTLQVGFAILVEAALSFLGFGIQPPISTWGNMLTNAQTYIFYAPWLAFPPGVMIVITVLAINFLGDGLRDALDPNRRR